MQLCYAVCSATCDKICDLEHLTLFLLFRRVWEGERLNPPDGEGIYALCVLAGPEQELSVLVPVQ